MSLGAEVRSRPHPKVGHADLETLPETQDGFAARCWASALETCGRLFSPVPEMNYEQSEANTGSQHNPDLIAAIKIV
jgi:hypothetical protein